MKCLVLSASCTFHSASSLWGGGLSSRHLWCGAAPAPRITSRATVGRCAPTPAGNSQGGPRPPHEGVHVQQPASRLPLKDSGLRGYVHLRTRLFLLCSSHRRVHLQEVITEWRLCRARQRKPAGPAPGQAVQVGTQVPSAWSATSDTLGPEVSPLTSEESRGRGTPGPNGGRRDGQFRKWVERVRDTGLPHNLDEISV